MWLAAALVALALFQTPDLQSEGVKALEEQRYDAAVSIFAKLVESEPKDYGAHFHLALAQSMLNKDSEAISGYRRVLELKPGLYEAELNLGILLLRNKEAAEAFKLLQSAAEKKNEFRPVYYAAEAALAAGNPESAEPLFDAATKLDPKSAAAEAGLARSLAKQKRPADAEPHFLKAAELDPQFGDALLEVAALYEANKETDKAIALYAKFPENAAARERMGELLLETGKADQALQHLEAAVQRSPTIANRYALATAYIQMKQTAKAVPLLEAALKEEPANTDLRMMYGRALRQERKYAAAAQEFYRVAQAKPDSAEAWSDLAGMLILTENYQPALGALDKVRALGAEKAAHHFFRAIVLDKHQIYEGALASYERFLSLSEGKNPDEEFKSRQRIRIIKKELEKR